MYVAFNMVKLQEVLGILNHSHFHAGLMIYTALAVIIADFLIGVLSAIVIYAIALKLLLLKELRDFNNKSIWSILYFVSNSKTKR